MNLTLKEKLDLQRTARIITESQYNKLLNEEEGADLKDLVLDPKIISLAAKIVKQPVDTVKDKIDNNLSGKSSNEKKTIDESLALTLALALPMILEAGGNLADLIKRKYGLSEDEVIEYKKWKSNYDRLDKSIKSYGDPANNLWSPDQKNSYNQLKTQITDLTKKGNELFGSEFGKTLKKRSHQVHKVYTSPILAILWIISKFTNKDSDLRNPKIRVMIANIIYAVAILTYAGAAVYKTVLTLPGVAGAIEGVLDSIKAGKSVAEIVKDLPAVVDAFAT